ncbi:hypothetical protein OH77DRAFT_1519174 [Trametes cingulata]|nr:hypothetical protein OH77DRAFT_1519174 [Trametes cingulata]
MASSSTAAAEAELLQLVQVVHDTYVANLCTAAAATWLSYDILLTFSQEVELIWSCQGWLWYNGFNGTLLSAVIGEAIFLMRLYASYNRTKTILFTIIFLFMAEFVTGITTASLVVSSLSVTPRPPDFPLPGCLFTPPKHVNLSTMGGGYERVYFLLILYKFARNVSLRKAPGSSRTVPIWELPRISPLVFSFLRDSAFYFFLVFLGNTLNLVFEIVFAGRALIPMGTIWLMVIYALSASRLCLNTRDAVYRNRLPTAWGDDIELDDRVSGPSELSNASMSSGNLKKGAESDRDMSLHRGKLDLDVVDVLESNDGYASRLDEVRSRDYEMDSWLVVDSRGRARRMTHILHSGNAL